jgi:hypothetical protein
MIISVFNGEQRALLEEMHFEIQILISIFILAVRIPLMSDFLDTQVSCKPFCFLQVVLGLYAVLFRTAIVEARRQVSKTKSFVAMIPVHVLTREVKCPCCVEKIDLK